MARTPFAKLERFRVARSVGERQRQLVDLSLDFSSAFLQPSTPRPPLSLSLLTPSVIFYPRRLTLLHCPLRCSCSSAILHASLSAWARFFTPRAGSPPKNGHIFRFPLRKNLNTEVVIPCPRVLCRETIGPRANVSVSFLVFVFLSSEVARDLCRFEIGTREYCLPSVSILFTLLFPLFLENFSRAVDQDSSRASRKMRGTG